jgi:hypothetical protein
MSRPPRDAPPEPPPRRLREGPLSLRRRARGPGGLASRMALAALAVVLLLALVIGVLAVGKAMRPGRLVAPNTHIETR